jgi:putative endonuclease
VARTVEQRRAALARGRAAEARVADALARAGWSVLARNWRGGGGELDLVVSQGARLRFVEVKARAPGDPAGLALIGPGKQARLTAAAEAWLAQEGRAPAELCFALALVDGPHITWLDDPFDAP